MEWQKTKCRVEKGYSQVNIDQSTGDLFVILVICRSLLKQKFLMES